MNNLNVFNENNKSKLNKQAGLTLLEMLIAMVIGLFLLLGLTTSYLSSKKSSNTRDQISILEDNGRTALEILTKTIQHAGYKPAGLIELDETFNISGNKPTSKNCGGGVNSVVNPNIFPNTSTSDNNVTGDTIGVIYQGDNDLNTDCGGVLELPAECRVGAHTDVSEPKIYNTFFIDASNDTLQCAGSLSADKVTIAEGVENIQIRYGINADDDEFKSVERYVSAADVGPDWGLVVSVQVAILLKSLNPIKDVDESQTFSLLDQPVVSPTDRHQRAVFSTTINLRNQ